MKNHTQTIQALDKSLQEARRLNRVGKKYLIEIMNEIERTKFLLNKINKDYAITRTNY